jgi:hypothetical protein
MEKPIMLDAKKIQTIGEKKKNTDCTINVLLTKEGKIDPDKTFDLRSCMYSPAQVYTQNQDEQAMLLNIMYNELLWYRLFAQYYGFVMRADLTLSQTDKTDNVDRQIQQIIFESNQATQHVAKASELMQQVIVTVDKVRYTFPVHI